MTLPKAYVINLNHRTDRLKKFFGHPDAQLFERVCAIDKNILTLVNQADVSSFFNVSKFQSMIGRPPAIGETACTLSHIKCWQLGVQDNSIAKDDYFIIAEDDVVLMPNFTHHIQSLLNNIRHTNINLVILQRFFWEKIPEFKLANQPVSTWQFLASTEPDFFNNKGSSLYAIKKSFAIELLHSLEHYKPYWLADSFTVFCPIETICVPSPLLGVIPNDIHAESDLESEREQLRKSTQKDTMK